MEEIQQGLNVENMGDEELRELIKRAQAVLDGREKEKRLHAVREIERLAKEHGIEVDVKGKRRGRPPKAKG